MELLIKAIIVFLTGGVTLLLFKYGTAANRSTAIRTIKEKKNLIIQILVIITVCSIALFLTNTQIKKVGKDSYITNFENFVGEVKKDHKEYSKADWIGIEKEYQELSEKERLSYEKLFTKEDTKRISKLEGEYLSYRTSGFIDNIMETTKDAFNNAVEYIDGFMEAKKTEVQDKVNEIIMEEFNNTIESDTIDE